MNQTQYEEQLRTSLLEAADGHGDIDLDPMSIISDGTRVVRRRRIGQAVAGTAAATLVAVGAWAVTSGMGRDDALPAGRSTPIISSASQWQSTTLENLSGELNGSPRVGPSTFSVSVNPSVTNGENIRYAAVAADGTTSSIGGSGATLTGRATTWGTGSGLDGRVVLGVMPKAAKDFQVILPMDPKGGHASTHTTAAIPGTDLQAFAIFFEVRGDAEKITDIVWTDGRGGVTDAQGRTVPATQVADAGRGTSQSLTYTTVFVTDTTLGTFSDGGASWFDLGQVPRGEFPEIFTSRQGEPGSREVGLFALLVPGGATHASATLSGITAEGIAEVHSLGGRSLIAVPFTGTGQAKRSVTLNWTDAAGVQQTHTS